MKVCFLSIGVALVVLAVFACTASAQTTIYDHFDDPATVGDGWGGAGTLWYVGGYDGSNIAVPAMADSILNLDGATKVTSISSNAQWGPGTIIELKLDDIEPTGNAMGWAAAGGSAMLRNDQPGGLWQFVVDNGVDDIYRSGDLFEEGTPKPGSLYGIAWNVSTIEFYEDGVLLAQSPISMTGVSEAFAYSYGHIGWDYVAFGDAPVYVQLPGDADDNGIVNDADAAILADNWLTQGTANWGDGDFNGDGNVDDIDATILATNWQATVTSAAVPEPSAFVLLASILLAVTACRARKK